MVFIRAKNIKSARNKAKERGLSVSSVKYDKKQDMKTGTNTLRIFSAKKK